MVLALWRFVGVATASKKRGASDGRPLAYHSKALQTLLATPLIAREEPLGAKSDPRLSLVDGERAFWYKPLTCVTRDNSVDAEHV